LVKEFSNPSMAEKHGAKKIMALKVLNHLPGE
jgi:hypothetical protein